MSKKADEVKKSDSRKEEILKASYELFIEQGYEKSSMRQIAAKVGVSLGLASYHFTSKREIAAEILRRKLALFTGICSRYVNRAENPILYSALLVSLNYTVLSSKKYLAFYKDMLREDILLDVIAHSGNDTYMSIRNKYQPELDNEKAEHLGWYGNYISVSMERTLVLYADGKPLPGTIPEIIFRSYIELWHFPGIEVLAEDACRKSKQLILLIIAEHPELFD